MAWYKAARGRRPSVRAQGRAQRHRRRGGAGRTGGACKALPAARCGLPPSGVGLHPQPRLHKFVRHKGDGHPRKHLVVFGQDASVQASKALALQGQGGWRSRAG